MGRLKILFKQTLIYGLATVLPRMLNVILVPLYTTKGVLSSVSQYGQICVIYSYFVLFNVVLAYGMEIAFFRFFNSDTDKNTVVGTATISLIGSSFGFFILACLLQNKIALWIDIDVKYIHLILWILLLDALVIVPFAWLRATQKPVKYACVKIASVIINLALNLFFLRALKPLASKHSIFEPLYRSNFEISYIFIANLIASAVTLLLISSFYVKIKYTFSVVLWKSMLKYGLPILVAGIAFSINETFDRILLKELLPPDIATSNVGMYSACYKLSLFMTLFVSAYKLGVEPFFFSHAAYRDANKNYAFVMEFFVALGSVILLAVVVFSDALKPYIIRSHDYWKAMWIVPIILIANFCLGIYHNLSVWYKITDKTVFGAYISVVGAIITLLINGLFIKSLGYKASAIATLAAYSSMMLLSYYFGRKHYPIPYNIKKIGLYLGLSIGFSLLSFYRYRTHYGVGITLFIVLLAVVITSEKEPLRRLLKSY